MCLLATTEGFKPVLPGSSKVMGAGGLEAVEEVRASPRGTRTPCTCPLHEIGCSVGKQTSLACTLPLPLVFRIRSSTPPRVPPSLPPSPLQGELVTPEPGFVIKTRIEDGSADSRKVFINVCQSPMVALPAPKTQLDAEGNEHQVPSVPLVVDVHAEGAWGGGGGWAFASSPALAAPPVCVPPLGDWLPLYERHCGEWEGGMPAQKQRPPAQLGGRQGCACPVMPTWFFTRPGRKRATQPGTRGSQQGPPRCVFRWPPPPPPSPCPRMRRSLHHPRACVCVLRVCVRRRR
jgi:hypothetical protein